MGLLALLTEHGWEVWGRSGSVLEIATLDGLHRTWTTTSLWLRRWRPPPAPPNLYISSPFLGPLALRKEIVYNWLKRHGWILGWECQDLPRLSSCGDYRQSPNPKATSPPVSIFCKWHSCTREDDDSLAPRMVLNTSYDCQLMHCVRLPAVNKASCGDVLQAVTVELMTMVAVWLGEQYCIRATHP